MEQPVSMTLEMSPALDEKLSRLAQASHSSPDVVLLKALKLYDIAVQAQQENNRVGIVDRDHHLVAEVTGI